MRFDILTLFPEMFGPVLGSSILKRAAEQINDRPPVVAYHVTNIRDHTIDKHGKVDRPPYGGGPGMVMQCQPVWDAVQAVDRATTATRILMTPQGEPFTQAIADDLATHEHLVIIAGHYEGIDERVIDALAPIRQISIGDYVLSGGEIPAMVLIDTIVRLLPGVLGDDTSTDYESFSQGSAGLLDCPHYTRPPLWEGRDVPDVLLSGNHAEIAAWRRLQSGKRTQQRRPDLIGE
jgi:tRNA (guanine37-N1)-methyltransferase